jgi:hypothetical protein
MKTKINLIVALASLAFAFSACSFSTANISELKFGKNETANPAATSFNVGEKIFAVAVVSNSMGKHKVKFNLKYENVAGKGKGESFGKPELEVDGDSQAYVNFNSNLPGDYSVEAVLVDEQGKELSKKSGTIKITGSAPVSPAAAKTDDADSDSDGKSDDK